MLSVSIIDALITICAAIVSIQFHIGGFIVVGLIFVIIRAVRGGSAKQEDGSAWGLTRSMFIYVGQLFKRDDTLNEYSKMYYLELKKSNEMWQKINQ